jgi:DNA recombination protein RmuC
LHEDPDLLEYALSRQIILATPTSFVALLKAVAYGWRQLALADNASEIRELAEDLYGRLSTFVGHMNKLGRQLGGSIENYNRAVGSLEHKVLPGARKFVELGVQAKKKMEKLETLDPVPRTMIESPADDDESSEKDGESQEKTLQ